MNDWDDYRFFLAAAESGTLSRAAERLQVSQPTVGRRISALEARLGVPLFDRLPRRLELTPAGEQTLASARAAEQELLGLELRARAEGLTGTIRISTTEGLGTKSLVPRLSALRRRLPGIRFEIAFDVELVDVLRREADVVLRLSRPGSADLVGRRLAKARFVLCASREYLAGRRAPRSVNDLSSHTLILPSRQLARIPPAKWLARIARSGPPPLECNTMLGQLAMARSSLGIACLPRYMIADEPDLEPILPRAKSWTSDLWLLTHRDLRAAPAVRAVLDALVESYRGAEL